MLKGRCHKLRVRSTISPGAEYERTLVRDEGDMFMFENKKMDDTTNNDNTNAEIYIVSELGKLRHEIEHNIIKNVFFKHTKKFVTKILEEGFAYELYKSIFESVGMDVPYEKDEFNVEMLNLDEDTFHILLELPKPEYVPLCYRMYFIFKNDFSDTAMYTIERGLSSGFICGWNKEGEHENYHNITSPEWEENIGPMKEIEAIIIDELYNNRFNRVDRDDFW